MLGGIAEVKDRSCFETGLFLGREGDGEGKKTRSYLGWLRG